MCILAPVSIPESSLIAVISASPTAAASPFNFAPLITLSSKTPYPRSDSKIVGQDRSLVWICSVDYEDRTLELAEGVRDGI
jgi:hypothetical protein